MDFNCEIIEQKDHCILKFKGNLIEKNQANDTLSKVDVFLDRNINRFVVDLGQFNYMNSTGLNTLLTILTKARKSGGEAVICNVSPNISSLLSVTKLNSVFSVHNSLASAEAELLKETH